jgi:GT2 family glycosyltransferase
MVKASGCIVTYNAVSNEQKKKQFLREIKNLIKKTVSVDFTLYIVDNASSDNTVEILKTAFENEKSLKIISNDENVGFGKAHNQVIDLIDSDYHFIINPDIIIKDDVIGKMCSYFEHNKECGMLSPDIRFPDGRRQVLAKRNPKLKYLLASRLSKDREKNKCLREYGMLDNDMSKPFRIENASGCFVGIRSELFRKLGGFDERYFMYFEDFDLARRLSQFSQIWYYPEAVVYHEWGRDSKRNNKLRLIHMKSTLKYFLKWGF